jgi:hypothetical protein
LEKGKKNTHSTNPKEKGQTVTVPACINVSENYMPPTVIFKGKTLHSECQRQLPPCSYIFTSDNGYIYSEIFFEFLEESIMNLRTSSENWPRHS